MRGGTTPAGVSVWDCNYVLPATDMVTISAGHSVTVSLMVQGKGLNGYSKLAFTAGDRISF